MTPYPCHPTGTLSWLATRRRPEFAAKQLKRMIADCELMYPWPALAESWRRDLECLAVSCPPEQSEVQRASASSL